MSDNVTYDWCWQCCQYHRTEAGKPINTQCPRPKFWALILALLFLASPILAADPVPPGVCNCGKVCTGDRCAAYPICGQGLCYVWKEVPGTQGDQVALFYLGQHCGSYRYSADVYMPLEDGEWGKPCKLPTPPPKRAAAIHEHPAASFVPMYAAPIRSSGRSGGC